ncbi:c-type cytochrome [Verrucomicrobium sp. BvORR106]|uniref:DUF7133 domain-containing protein n=1 Tax=Verrucomicrobium sp. BvORR106 TaxID=1403819 RepID=UPI00068F2802|nr:c-type cytochrome [Verrucomicrobium sp. BvORR106]
MRVSIAAAVLCFCGTDLLAVLPAKEALVMDLNAGAQETLRQAASLPPLISSRPVSVILDASGAKRRAGQPMAACRPELVGRGRAATLRFDGRDDFLVLDDGPGMTPEATVVVLAAPQGNAGGFAALLSTTLTEQDDFTSGLNLDQGPQATTDLSVLNVETAGGGGFRNLMEPTLMGAAKRPFGGYHVFSIRTKMGKGGTELFFDGIRAGARDRLESHIGLEQVVLGARYYSHEERQPPHAQGFFHGDIARVLIFNRVLTDAELQAVEQEVMQVTPALHAMLQGRGEGHALETLASPPLVQMLVPGFSVEELPLRIGNLNNIRYRQDGKVVALGYDGRIHLLSDSDSDGLEDRSEPYWSGQTMRGAIGMVVTTKEQVCGPGVMVGSKGKVSFFPDRNGDDRADGEEIAASGWKESFHGVDTVGLAMDPKDGSFYFGLGCANFADAYLIDKKTGKSAYDIHSTHGTIQKLSADFKQRETVATGLRFTCALAFNRAGDLFATEQEGATWLPNGNPFDELLHIQKGKHYGFPPRHPKHLPDVVDEPPVLNFSPQHQSTVGMVFNEGVNGGPSFGPGHWQGDALVCGQSRGKLWRVRLVKTPQGYVAQSHLIACMGMLLVDACVTPQGDLLVACHSGPPDWGTGPAGEGRLFKIRQVRKELPQPVMAWAAAPDEFRIAFDRLLEPQDWVAEKVLPAIRIEAGLHVRAGDRYEVIRPGYQVVRDQMAMPRRWVQALDLRLSEDRRTLVLKVAPQTEPVHYAISLPVPAGWSLAQPGLQQAGEMDVDLTLDGVMAEVEGERLVLPHPALDVSKVLTAGSADHEAFLKKAAGMEAGLQVRTLVDVSNPFVPAVQPGSKWDWNLADDAFARQEFQVTRDDGSVVKANEGMIAVVLKAPHQSAGGLYLGHDGMKAVLTPDRLLVPWALRNRTDGGAGAGVAGRAQVQGNWQNGRKLFFGQAVCFTCHTVRGEGHAFGPDLSNLIHRDRDSVWQDVLKPSATINPDQSGSLLKLKDGTSMTGIVRNGAGATVLLALPGGTQMEIPRDKVLATEPLKVSLMPEGLVQALSREEQEDLLTFLLKERP